MLMRPVLGFVLASLLATSASMAATWEPLGPQGVTGQTVVVDPVTPGVVYLGVYTSGVWKSTDRGQTWAPTGRATGHVPYSIAVDPVTPSNLYAGSYAEIVRSTDGGASWTRLDAGLVSNETAYALAIDPATPSTIYAGIAKFVGVQTGGVIKSVDSGTTWTRMNNGLTDLEVYALAIDPFTTSTVYAGTGSGVFKSVDGGASWALAGSGAAPEAQAVVIDHAVPSNVWAGTEDGVFHSTDGGATWNATGPLTFQAGVTTIALDPVAPNVVYAGSYSGTDQSTDGGATWARVWGPSIALAFDPHRHLRVYSVNVSGFFITDNGALTWNRSETGLYGINLVSVAADLTHPGTFYGSNFHTMYSTTDFGTTWSHYLAPTSDPFILGVDPRHHRVSFVTAHAVAGKSLGYSSRNGGRTWHASNGLASANAVISFAAASSDPRTMYAGTFDGIFKSRNGGGSWRLLRGSPIGPAVTALKVDPTSVATVYAGVEGQGVMKTTNGGATWSPTGWDLNDVNIASFAIDPHDLSTVYASAYGFARVFKTTDAGASWNEVSVGLPPGAVFEHAIGPMLVDPFVSTTVYVGVARRGVFRTTDGGASWSEFNPGLAAQAVSDLLVGPGSTVYAGTSQGLFRLITP